jgi:hypothetical protein
LKTHLDIARSSWEAKGVIATMLVVGVYEVIAGLALIVTGAFVGFDGWPSLIWGWALIVLGALLLILWFTGV